MSESDPIRVFIAEDHAIVRKGIRALLTLEPGIEVIGEASNGQEAVRGIESSQPDVILMDLVMPEMDGIEAIRQVMARHPEAHILVLTSFATDDKVFPAIKAGAMGYLLKDSEPREVVQAIRQVHRGECSLHPRIARKLMRELSQADGPPPTADPLTKRELDVLRLVAQGKSNRQIADELVITVGTVRVHVSNILGKLHLASRTQATLYALREGLASLEDVDEASEDVDEASEDVDGASEDVDGASEDVDEVSEELYYSS